ncbi:hypothetical protein [Leadbetterella byssophila]|uniref:Uncharacterized protein n=1 Tax=Leadbetterella byssophila (strain DSM 17132 / JCM 16389 / KACC 11308 / NBRC 106382 / 4M15) TaxID=649349 RepID=E4RT07_LEAB4|nr:hypothetical protein [Leadbetterella byssophila]ADQ17715.1 hypothetical protein Lbys_2019 [Leadbetterella byssophila DSM 17132]
MIQTFTSTQNEIIRYVYHETSPSENEWIEEQIAGDTDNLDFYLDCLQIKEEMDQIRLVPQDQTLERIFSYSRNYKPAV